MNRFVSIVSLFLSFAAVPVSISAQENFGSSVIGAPNQLVAPVFGPADLDQMLGPIALYPDPLIAELLPAAMQPAEIVQADRYLQNGGDPNQVDAQPWSSAVKAMVHYPDVLKWMDENIAWTTQVGQAFLTQSEDMMNSIQRLRSQAQSLGNLQTTSQQNVVVDNGAIEIVPANPEIIYVPVYQPEIVYRRHAIYGAAPFITFGIGFSIGSWLNRDWDWHHHQVVVWERGHARPRDWWYRPAPERFRPGGNFHVWQPRVAERRWSAVDRGFEVRREPVRVIEPRPREIERRPEPARPEIRREPARVEPSRPEPRRNPEPERRAPEIQRTAPAAPTRAAPAPTPHANGPLVGVHSAPETRAYSNRGQQSRGNQNPPGRQPDDSHRGKR
jgi:hypothetical protein